ncbi:hypothetical protein [Flagellimonas sp. 2504JD4-2]
MRYTFLFFICTTLCFSQQLPDVSDLVSVPNSPEAEAFESYGNIPISYYVGRPNVSVPIYMIQGKEMSVPVSLTYESSGIKVQSIATSAGTGWNLNAGGMVTRQMNDMPDDMISGKPTHEIGDSNIVSMNSYLNSLRDPTLGYYISFENYEHSHQDIVNFLARKADQASGDADLMPDTFSFYAPGLSGSIVIDYGTGNAISIDDPDVSANYTKAGNGAITAWTITAANGTVYYFNKPEETTTTNQNDQTWVYNSAWHLTKIESPNKKDVFDFTFIDQPYWDQFQPYHNRETRQNRLSACGQTNYDPSLPANTFTVNGVNNDYKIKQPIPSTIKHNTIEIIQFSHSGERSDLGGRNKLSNIYVKYGADILRQFSLNHSYFTASSNPTQEDEYRLRLDSIDIYGNYNLPGPAQQSPQSYAFDYYGTGTLPGRNSKAIDYLGYYNGVTANTTLVPQYTDEFGNTFSGADRSSNFNFLHLGMLKEIHYPTGGSTEFTFDKVNEYITTLEPTSFGEGLGSVSSGTDPNADPNEFDCDDGFWHWPHTSTVSFTVDSSEATYASQSKYWFQVSSSGNYSQTGRVFFMAIYQSTSTKDFCDIQTMIQNQDPNLKHHSFAAPLNGSDIIMTSTQSSYLPPGDYKVYLANSLLGKSYSFQRSGKKDVEVSHPVSSNAILSKIVDKTNTGETVIRRLDYEEQVLQQKIQFTAIKHTDDNSSGASCTEYETLERYSTNLYQKTPYDVTYTKVKETREDAQGNTIGSTQYEFYNQGFYTLNQVSPYPIAGVYVPKPGQPYLKNYPLNGQLKKMTQYDKDGRIITDEENIYDFEASVVTTGTHFYGESSKLDICTVGIVGEIDTSKEKLIYVTSTNSPSRACATQNGFTVINSWQNVIPNSDDNVRFHSFKTQLKEKNELSYLYTGTNPFPTSSITQQTTYTYGSAHNMPISVKTVASNSNDLVTNTQYPGDLTSPSTAEQALITQHRKTEPIEVETFEDLDDDGTLETNEQLSTQYTLYKDWGNGLVLPEYIQAAKGTETLENRIQFDYDNGSGNIKEANKEDGSPITYIWGYNEQFPIAKIENASYSQISSQVSNLQTLSNADDDTTIGTTGNEGALRLALTSLRNSVPDALVTTYTYDPLIGVTSTTDPSGYTSYYVYDHFGRLKYIKNKDGEVLGENRYNYRVEPIDAQTSASLTSVTSGQTVTLTTTATGGTGNFQYNWTVSNGTINDTFTNTTGILDVITTDDHAPSFTVDCQVLDTQTNESSTTQTNIDVTVPQALTVNGMYISPGGVTKSVGDSVTYSVDVSGGSGNYDFEWTKTSNQTTSSYGGNSDSTTKTVVNGDCPSFAVSCKVTDTVTNETITKGTFILVTSGCPQQ